MRKVFTLCLGLILVAGCGTNVVGTVTLAEARATCLAWNNDPTGGIAEVEAIVLLAETSRDIGQTEAGFVVVSFGVCEGTPDPSGCKECMIQVGAAIWN